MNREQSEPNYFVVVLRTTVIKPYPRLRGDDKLHRRASLCGAIKTRGLPRVFRSKIAMQF